MGVSSPHTDLPPAAWCILCAVRASTVSISWKTLSSSPLVVPTRTVLTNPAVLGSVLL